MQNNDKPYLHKNLHLCKHLQYQNNNGKIWEYIHKSANLDFFRVVNQGRMKKKKS